MKKLLLVSAIVFGSASFAAAQAVDAVQTSSKAKPTAVNSKLVAKKQKEDAQANKLAGARPTVSNVAATPAVQRPGTARRPKPRAAVAKKS